MKLAKRTRTYWSLFLAGAILAVTGILLTPGPEVTGRTFLADLVLFTGIGLILWGKHLRRR